MKNKKIKRFILLLSIPSLALALLHIFIPNLGIDFISFSFFLLAYLPLFIPFIKSVELPGGAKIDLVDLEEAMHGITETENTTGSLEIEDLFSNEIDPNMILVKLRIEIEKKLRELINQNRLGHRDKMSPRQMAEKLANFKILTKAELSSLLEIINLGNQAVHGAEVQASAINWSRTRGKDILLLLDKKMKV